MPGSTSSPVDEHTRLLGPSSQDAPPSAPREVLPERQATQPITKLRGVSILSSLAVLIFLQATNFSVLTTTQSTVAQDLDAYSEVVWFTAAYLISMSSVAPLVGRLSQIFSPRHCILIASVLFAFGSIVTSQAPSLAVFLLGRVITGLGAAGVLTLCVIFVVQLSSKERRGLYFGLINTAVTTGVSLGAVIGGALLEPIGWRTLFWLQAPLALISGAGVFFSIPSSYFSQETDLEGRTMRQKLLNIDYLGATLLTAALVTLLTGLSSPQILYVPIGVAGGLVILFVLNEIFLASDPVIPIKLLKSRGALLTCIAQLVMMMSRWLVLFYSPVYALAVRGWPAASAGSMLIPTNAGFAAGGLVAGVLHIKRAGSFYISTLVSAALFPVTLLVLAELATEDSSVYAFIAATFANGFVTGCFLNYTLAHVLHLTPSEHHPVATSLVGTFRGFAGSFGSAIGGGIFVRILKVSLEIRFLDQGMEDKDDLIRRLIGQPALVSGLSGIEKEVARQGYVDAIRGLFVAGVGLATLVIFIQAGTGWQGPIENKTSIEADDDEE